VSEDKYAAERFDPAVPTCGKSPISLLFNGRALFGNGVRTGLLYPAVSGRPIDGRFDYSADRQKLPNEGPIPEGRYWIQPSELQENSWYRLRNPSGAWGNYWITIHPFPDTITHGRGGFFIHGGSTAGSAGCIDLTPRMDKFVEAIRGEVGESPECYIELIVRYSK
jgi:hypothetical protein